MTKPQVLVTGGTGFLGARLARELVLRGNRVKVLARASSSLRGLEGIDPSMLEVAQGDVTVGHTVYRALAGCDRLFHVAAEFKIWDRRPAKILDASIVGTRETLEAARQKGIEKIVVTSSTAAVGATPDATLMNEEHPFNRADSTPYIVAKRRAEEVALDMAARGMPIVVVNPATIMGGGDYKPTPSGDLILTFLNWNLPFGVPWSDGGFSVVDVEDVVAGHIAAMERGRPGERYILGGNNVVVRDLFVALAEVTGLRGPGLKATRVMAEVGGALGEAWGRISGSVPQLTYKMARDYVGWYVWVSSERARAELGYAIRPLRATLVSAIRFFIEHGYVPADRVRKMRFDLRTRA
ncbi:MAG TPA: NAD-dependent epimerase/dehydratase family protein [Polyangiaceae bacterium]|nr:NAD-dependent epimerase/dehydratase family protein [Polyangiaceae bacterium]